MARRAAVKLLAGDNPQIPMGEGDAPVQAWIAAVPGWKRAVARRVDALVSLAVPDVRKAVKWNSPLYGTGGAGVGGGGWFLSQHCFATYVKVTFFRGRLLEPMPPGASKQRDVRYLDVREHDGIDEATFVAWVRQASRLPGEHFGKEAAVKTNDGSKANGGDAAASRQIEARILELGGWRGETLARVRAIVRAADPGIVEEWKWDGPVWSCGGLICTGEAYKATVKLTFAKGASLADPKKLFNASLAGGTRRAIDLREGERIDAKALQALVREAIAHNESRETPAKAPKRARKAAKKAPSSR